MKYWGLIILLVLYLCAIAHVNAILMNKDLVTSLLTQRDVAHQGRKNLINLDNIVAVRTPSSAVQDWSLVCQQLCGAALGGAVCAPFCKKLSFLPMEVQLENAEVILDSNEDYICPQLCGLQLGDDACTCKNYITDDFNAFMKASENTNVCAILCDITDVTLTGCTPCNKKGKKRNSEYVVLETVNTLTADDDSDETTPDWDQLCISLCKTGDGGSLCKCDLSPFVE